MVQEFHVVRCFTCESFQVQQVKKASRWICKMCGEKQSLLKEFGRGSGADCRRHVQKLNATRGAMMEEQERKTGLLWEQQVEADGEEEPEEERDDQVRQTQLSRWSKYLDTPEEVELEEGPGEETVLLDRQQLHGNNMTDRKRKRTDTPEQFNSSSLMRKPIRPSSTTTSLTHTSLPGPNQSCPLGLTHTSPPGPNQSSPLGLTQSSPPGPNQSSPLGLTQSSPPGPNQSSPLGPNQSSPLGLTHTSPPSKKKMNPPSQKTGPVSRWTCFLSSDCQVQEEPNVSGWSPTMGGTRPHPLPVSSVFEIDEFNPV